MLDSVTFLINLSNSSTFFELVSKSFEVLGRYLLSYKIAYMTKNGIKLILCKRPPIGNHRTGARQTPCNQCHGSRVACSETRQVLSAS